LCRRGGVVRSHGSPSPRSRAREPVKSAPNA
jgi:hypothetical protein